MDEAQDTPARTLRFPLVRRQLVVAADWLAVAIAVSLPWSTSATAILVVLWLIALVPSLDPAQLRGELQSAAGGLPVLLWLLAALGMLWADATWAERLDGLGGFHRLLVIPLLLTQFRHSARGVYPLYGFLVSCAVLLVMSVVTSLAAFSVAGKEPGIPVKDYIAQSTEFLVCGFVLAGLAVDRVRAGHDAWGFAIGAFALLFFAGIFQTTFARTALIVFPVLALVLGFRLYRWRGVLVAVMAAMLIGAALWTLSASLRERVARSIEEVQAYRAGNDISTSSGMRLEIWKGSLSFIASAPVLGHGTGSIRPLYRGAAGEAGSPLTTNPHSQIFGVAIQLGLIGAALLVAMWAAHLALFRGFGPIAWIGTVVVVQNIVAGLFNSHLFDFFHGWLYVFGCGVAGGIALRRKSGGKQI